LSDDVPAQEADLLLSLRGSALVLGLDFWPEMKILGQVY
jgi:hypothetical protein